MTRTVVLLVGSLLLTAGCDPGWRYRVLGAQMVDDPSRTRSALESHGVGATVHGWLFVADVSIDLELTNRGPGPLYIDTSLLRAVDARGSNLRMIERVPSSRRYSDNAGYLKRRREFSRAAGVRRQSVFWASAKPRPQSPYTIHRRNDAG